MIRVDETDPVGELEPSFPYRDVTIRRGADFKDHYDVQSEIGRGKFGTVYRCKEKVSNLSLAAKVVNTMKKEDRRAVEREVEIMRRLQHPRLIQLYDAIDTGKQIYVILELIEGGELFERVIDDDFVLTERSCAVFMRQICEGIEFIHAQNILHLDLKPENILCLTKEGNRIKIIDFGLARQYDPNKKLQVLFGTPEFVAPEVVNFDQIGFGTDMWSIGVICYVLLSGLSPFMGDTDIETMANVTIAKYDFDHDAFTDISEDAKDFIKRLLLKDKEKRASATQCREHRWLVRKEERQVDKERLISYKVSTNLTKIGTDSNFWQVSPRVNNKEELDVAKENLRIFVERWREHPDSPYTIEMSYIPHISRPSEIDESTSLHGPSPSPRESLCSTPSESGITTINGVQGSIEVVERLSRENNEFFLGVPNIGLALERRASEGISTREKPRDPASQIVLAEEIIRLSDHLRAIATNAPSCVDVSPNEKSAGVIEGPSKKKVNKIAVPSLMDKPKHNEITEKLSSIIRRRKTNGTTFYGNRSVDRSTYTETFTDNASNSGFKDETTSNIGNSFTVKPVDEPTLKSNVSIDDRNYEESRVFYVPTEDSDMDLTPPWRRIRVKRSFGETSRDVPRISNLHDLHKSLNLDEPTNTKDLLLQLLGEWEEASSSRTSGIGRNSVSVDWYGEESIARKTMNSLAEYFQSKQRTGQPQVNF